MSTQHLSIPKHLSPHEAHADYESHRHTSDGFRRQKIEDAVRAQAEFTHHKFKEDLEAKHELEEQHKRKPQIPLDPHNVVDEGMLVMNGHVYVEAGLLNRTADIPLDREMDDNISFINHSVNQINPVIEDHAGYINSRILPLEKVAKAEVKPYQQETQWTCSAACLKAVLNFYGIPVSERECGVYIRVRKNKGAETTDIVNAAEGMGFEAFEKSFTLDEAKDITDTGIPIICDIQSFTKPGAGHYVVLTGIEDNLAFLMDPNTPGNARIIPLVEFDKRWHDRAMKPPHEDMPHWGIVVLPPNS